MILAFSAGLAGLALVGSQALAYYGQFWFPRIRDNLGQMGTTEH
ncbi:hypothetical protein D082_29710 [Synechocystis sp. PCC 6714]|nr:hypothetical protein D082_29710 [Synechocystis sp. PCC 6714]